MPTEIGRLFDIAMAEMKRRRPDLRDKADSEVIEILTREYGPTETDDLVDVARLLESGDPENLDRLAKALGQDGAPKGN